MKRASPAFSSAPDLLRLGRRWLDRLKIPAGWQAEIYLEQSRFREAAWAEGRPDDTREGWTQGAALRALRGGRQGLAYVRDLSEDSAPRLWEQAVSAARYSPPDKHRFLPRPSEVRHGAADDVCPTDPSLFRLGVPDLRDRLAGWERDLLASDRRLKKVLKLSLEESEGASAVVNSRGVAVERPFTSVSLAVELMGQSNGDVQISWDSMERRLWRDLDGERVLSRARDRILGAFGAKPLPSGRWPVVLSPAVGVEFLELLSDALCADAVQHGRSFFAGRRGKRVASPWVTLVDDGRYPKGLASALYDDEGLPTRTTIAVEKGVLRDYLYDSHAAAREGRESTGNAGRGGLSDAPSPGSTNFYLAPGAGSAQDLLGDTRRAFYVEDVMGMHTADPVSGDFSVGASGRLVERGRFVRPVKGVTLAGNLLDLLKQTDAVADDLTWYGSFGAPTFRISELSLGGS